MALLVSGQAHPELAAATAARLGVPMAEVSLTRFPNGEKRVQIHTPLAGESVVILQSLCSPVDENLVELMLLIDAVERGGARRITLVVPWMGYSLQDKAFIPGMPISARVVANALSQPSVDHVILMDLHNPSIAGFFSVPTRVLSTLELFSRYRANTHPQSVVVAPDFGGLKRARTFAELCGAPLAHIEKSRNLITGEVQVHALMGANVQNEVCVVIDDVISTGSTVVEVAEALKQAGAKEVHFYATHGLFAGNAWEKLAHSQLDSLVVTDSLPSSRASANILKVLSLADLIAEELTHLQTLN